jgi:hypothetical protein
MPRKKNIPAGLAAGIAAGEAAAPRPARKPRAAKAAIPPGKAVRPPMRRASAVPAIISETKAAATVAPSDPVVEILKSGVSDKEQIALLAYRFWEARGRQGGSPEDDWFRAERAIRQRRRELAHSQ